MDYKDDFVSGDVVEFKVDGRTFEYKPVTAGQENDWLNEYLVPEKDTETGKIKNVTDNSKLNKCKLRNLVGVPWPKDKIKEIIGIDSEWKDLNNDQRWDLLSKLNPTLFSEIIINISKIDNPKKKQN